MSKILMTFAQVNRPYKYSRDTHTHTHTHTYTVKSSRMLHCVHWQVVTNVLKMHSASEVSVTTYQLTWHNIPQELSLYQ